MNFVPAPTPPYQFTIDICPTWRKIMNFHPRMPKEHFFSTSTSCPKIKIYNYPAKHTILRFSIQNYNHSNHIPTLKYFIKTLGFAALPT